MKRITKDKEKGVSILLAVMILSFILTVALGTSSVLLTQVKTIQDSSRSVKAFYAADTGIEEVLMLTPPSAISGTVGGASYQIFINASSTPSCGSPNYCIKSVGTYLDTQRVLEIDY